MDRQRKLSTRIRETARLKHLSLRTENSYFNWIKHYYFYNQQKDPTILSAEHIRNFLTYLAVHKKVTHSPA